MSRSNSYDFNLTANDAITQALQLIGEFERGQGIDGDTIDTCLTSLNMMLKSWQSQSIGLWKDEDMALFIDASSQSYNLGPTGNHASSSFDKTELASDAAASASTITVDSVSGMTDDFDRDAIIEATTATAGSVTIDGTLENNGIAILPGGRKICWYAVEDESSNSITITGTNGIGGAISETISTGPTALSTVYSSTDFYTVTDISINNDAAGDIEIGIVGNFIGIVLDSGTLQWTSIVSDLSTTTITLLDALTGAAATDNHIYTYKHKIQRPIEIIEARLRREDGTDVPIDIIGRMEYKALANKSSTGYTNQIYYDNQLDNAKLNIWPVGQSVKDYLICTVRTPLMDLDSGADDFEIPKEWFETIVYNLAVRISTKFGATLDPYVASLASELYNALKDWDNEDTSVYIGVDTSPYMSGRRW